MLKGHLVQWNRAQVALMDKDVSNPLREGLQLPCCKMVVGLFVYRYQVNLHKKVVSKNVIDGLAILNCKYFMVAFSSHCCCYMKGNWETPERVKIAVKSGYNMRTSQQKKAAGFSET